jgi:hypothetical protein
MKATFQDMILYGYYGMYVAVFIYLHQPIQAILLFIPILFFSLILPNPPTFLFRPIGNFEKNSLYYTCLNRLSSTTFKADTLSDIYNYVVPDIQSAYDSYREPVLVRYIALKRSGFLLSLARGLRSTVNYQHF